MLNKLISILITIINISAYALCGAIIGLYSYFFDIEPSMKPLFFIFLFFMFYVARFLNVIIHEAGHLVFGLLTGYKFSMFRILKYTFVKAEGKITLKKYNIPGSMGQCLMAPPELKCGKMPVVLFNYGGVIFNVLSAIISYMFFYMIGYISCFAPFLLMMALVGLNTALTNGIPMKNKMLSNDGYNTFEMLRNKKAVLSLWAQLKISACLTEGVRLKDMPFEWFYLPGDDEMENGAEAVMGPMYCSRLMDEGKFHEVTKLIEHFLKIKSDIIGLHRIQLTLDLMFCEMMTENRKDVIDKLYTKQIEKAMKPMSCFLSTIRTEYAYALLYEKDKEKAEGIFARFEKAAKNYPYPAEIEAEYEFINLVKEKANA